MRVEKSRKLFLPQKHPLQRFGPGPCARPKSGHLNKAQKWRMLQRAPGGGTLPQMDRSMPPVTVPEPKMVPEARLKEHKKIRRIRSRQAC